MENLQVQAYHPSCNSLSHIIFCCSTWFDFIDNNCNIYSVFVVGVMTWTPASLQSLHQGPQWK